MVCLYCGSRTEVINSRPQKRNNSVWRRRRCGHCHAVFTTQETTDYAALWLVAGKRGTVSFNDDQLFMSLYKGLEHRPTALQDARDLTNTIIAQLRSAGTTVLVESVMIATVAYEVLSRFDTAAATSYRAFHPDK